MPRIIKRKDVVLLLPPPSIPKNGESSKMAQQQQQQQPPSLDVLLKAHQMALERGEQLDIEARMTDEMRREWFARSAPFLTGTEGEGGEGPVRKKRKMSGGEKHTNGGGHDQDSHHSGSSIPPSSNLTHSHSPTWATKRLKPSLAEQQWHHRRRSYLPDDAESSRPVTSGEVSSEMLHHSAKGGEAQDLSAEGFAVIPAEHKPNGASGIGTGNWRRKPEVEVDKEEIQASASYWNTLLVRARKDRGPQWDYSTQSHQVDRYSRAYYTHMDKAPPVDEETESVGEGKEVEGKPNGEAGIPSFNALTRAGSISLPVQGDIKRMDGNSITASNLPPRSDSLYPGLSLSNSNISSGNNGGFTPSAPSTIQLQQMHQAQQNLLLQKQREQTQHAQVQAQSSGPGPGPGSGQPISSSQLFQFHQAQQQAQQRLPPHMQQHLPPSSSSSLHPQYSSPTSNGGGGLPHNTPSPAGGVSGLPRTVSPSSLYNGQGQNQNQRTNSFSSSTSNNPQSSNGTSSFPTYPPQPNPNPYPPPGSQVQRYPPPPPSSSSMGMKQPSQTHNQSPIQPPPRPLSAAQGQGPQYPHLTSQQQQQQQAWMQQASSMGLTMAQFQNMVQSHQMQQQQQQQQQQGGMNPQAIHQLGRPVGSGSVNLAQVTGGQPMGGIGGIGNGMRSGSGGPMLGGGGS